MNIRLVLALVLLAVVAVVCASLGNWQLDRAAERDAIYQAIESGRQRAPLALSADTPEHELQNWRQAQVQGVWLHQFTILLDNRNYNGRPGFWVATPMQLQAQPDTAVLILRGWIPRVPGNDQQLPDLTPPTGVQEVAGQLLERVPRLFELQSLRGDDANALPTPYPQADASLARVQNLDLSDYAAATGLKLMPVVMEQTSQDAGPVHVELNRDWPLPSIDSATNRGYALQWFSFAAIALGAWVVLVWRAFRRRQTRKPSNPDRS